MGKVLHTWSLMSASWQVFKKDKEVMIFPFLSAICTILVALSFIAPFYYRGFDLHSSALDADSERDFAYYGILFAFYFVNYFVTVFFNSAIIACANIRMRGGDPSVMDGLRSSACRLPSILGWAFIMATVGLFLRMLEERSKLLGRVVAGLLGVSFSLSSFLVIPILVSQRVGPMEALQKSALLLKKTWGEQVVGNFSFGLTFFLLSLPAIVFILCAIKFAEGFLLVLAIVAAVEYLILLSLIQSALQAIFQAAVYRYLQEGDTPQGFDAALLHNSIQPRR